MAGAVRALTGFANTLGRFTQAWTEYYPPVLGQQVDPVGVKRDKSDIAMSRVFKGTTLKRLQLEQAGGPFFRKATARLELSSHYIDHLEEAAVRALNEHYAHVRALDEHDGRAEGKDDRPVVVEHAILQCRGWNGLYIVDTKVWEINDAFVKSLRYCGGNSHPYEIPKKSLKEAFQVSWRAMQG
jgi:hypothetical protein